MIKRESDITLKLMTLCYAVISLIVLNSCAHTFASLDYDESSVEDGSRFYVKLDKNLIQLEMLNELVETFELDEIETEELPERVAFLTFDDGPSTSTDRLLDVLADEGVPAIFFLLGYSINSFPDSEVLMERMLDQGHYIGLHTMTHEYHTLYVGDGAPDRFIAEKFELQGLIYDLVAHHTNLCRAAYGKMTGFRPRHFIAVDEAGIKCIDWNIDPEDWRNDAQGIYEEVVRQVEDLYFPSELVIVFHEFEQTIEAMPAIIAFLREHGYVFKTYEPGYEFIYYQYRR